MAQNKKTRITSEQRQNMQFSEERFQLFESIQEMIDNEIKKRGLNKYQTSNPQLSLSMSFLRVHILSLLNLQMI